MNEWVLKLKLVHAQLLSHVWLFATPWTIVRLLLSPWDFFLGNTRVSCPLFLQGIFSTQEWNSCLLHLQVDSLPLSQLGSQLKVISQLIRPSFCSSKPIHAECLQEILSFCIFRVRKSYLTHECYSRRVQDKAIYGRFLSISQNQSNDFFSFPSLSFFYSRKVMIDCPATFLYCQD